MRGLASPHSFLGATAGAPCTWQSRSVSLCWRGCIPWSCSGYCTYVSQRGFWFGPVSVFSAMLRFWVHVPVVSCSSLWWRRGRFSWSRLLCGPLSLAVAPGQGGQCPYYAGRAGHPIPCRGAEAVSHGPGLDHGDSPAALGQGGRCPWCAGRAGFSGVAVVQAGPRFLLAWCVDRFVRHEARSRCPC